MNKIIRDRDGHFIGVAKNKRGIVVMHRHFEERHKPDDDDIDLLFGEAVFFLCQLKQVLDAKKDFKVVSINLSNDGKEVCIYPTNKQWIGLKLIAAKELVKQLEKVLG